MNFFFAILLLSIANSHSEPVILHTRNLAGERTYWKPRLIPGGLSVRSQSIQTGSQNHSQPQSREIADALDKLNCKSDPMCFIRKAQSLAERGEQLDLALACIERAATIPLVPNDAVPRQSFFMTLAYVQIRRREFDQAVNTLKSGARHAPEYARLDQYLNYLALAYENSGRIDDAIETYVTLAGGLNDISLEPSEHLVTLYRKRFGTLSGLKEKIEANRLRARRKFFVDNHVLNIPAPDWSLKDLDGKEVKLSDFSKNILVLSFVSAGGNSQEPLLRFIQSQYEKFKDKRIKFVLIDYTETPDPKTIKLNLERMGVTIPTLTDHSVVARRYETIDSLIVLIDEQGMIRFKNTVWHDYHPFVTEQIEFLLNSREQH
ncbi:MAG TPA: redoxin domain-containing protein [Pyrinomonadaceae bacterium]|nr:redoxin domain-containing protein [Pyrinomonadaceae bacterium]